MLINYSDIVRMHDRSRRRAIRGRARHLALDLLSMRDVISGAPELERPRVHVLYLHHVLRDEERSFLRLMAWLRQRHTIVSYSEAVRRIHEGAIDRPYVAITFDDGMRNNLRAAELLSGEGISACFFVCDAMAEERDPERIAEFCANELHIPPADFLSWDDMEQLLRTGHEIGNHSSRHATLARLSAPERADHISGSLSRLRSRLGNGVEHFAWPRGRFMHFSAAARDEVFRAGHTSCASAERGAHVVGQPRRELLCIRRDQIIAAWPLRHARYFIARGSRGATPAMNSWPPEWT